MMKRRLFLLSAGLATCATLTRARDGRRLVVAGGDLTGIVYALGAGDMLVGADTTSTWPEAAEKLPKFGYLRRLSAEGLLSLRPDLAVLRAEAGPPAVIDQLRAAGLDLAIAPAGDSLDVVREKVAFVGRVLGRETSAALLVEQFAARLEAVEADVAKAQMRPSVLFLISVGRGAPMAGGRDTAADAMIALAGGRNAAAALEGYKPLSTEALAALAPDILLLPDHVAAALGGADAARTSPGLTFPIPPKVVVMDGLKLLGMGLRAPEAAEELARALHPELAAQ